MAEKRKQEKLSSIPRKESVKEISNFLWKREYETSLYSDIYSHTHTHNWIKHIHTHIYLYIYTHASTLIQLGIQRMFSQDRCESALQV